MQGRHPPVETILVATPIAVKIAILRTAVLILWPAILAVLILSRGCRRNGDRAYSQAYCQRRNRAP
jgi:hypothetical protein